MSTVLLEKKPKSDYFWVDDERPATREPDNIFTEAEDIDWSAWDEEDEYRDEYF